MFFKKNKTPPAIHTPESKAGDSSVVASENISMSDRDLEKELQPPTAIVNSPSASPSGSRSSKFDTTDVAQSNVPANMEDEGAIVYPTGPKLAFITFALCISVFLVALVCISCPCLNDRS